MKMRLFDQTLNEIYVYLYEDKSIPRYRLKRWTDRLLEFDRHLEANQVPATPNPSDEAVAVPAPKKGRA